jgi:hypothetical protein
MMSFTNIEATLLVIELEKLNSLRVPFNRLSPIFISFMILLLKANENKMKAFLAWISDMISLLSVCLHKTVLSSFRRVIF